MLYRALYALWMWWCVYKSNSHNGRISHELYRVDGKRLLFLSLHRQCAGCPNTHAHTHNTPYNRPLWTWILVALCGTQAEHAHCSIRSDRHQPVRPHPQLSAHCIRVVVVCSTTWNSPPKHVHSVPHIIDSNIYIMYLLLFESMDDFWGRKIQKLQFQLTFWYQLLLDPFSIHATAYTHTHWHSSNAVQCTMHAIHTNTKHTISFMVVIS